MSEIDARPAADPMPMRPAGIVKSAVIVAAAGLLSGAIYLYAVRGPAILIDLGSGLRAMLCL